MSIHTSKAKFYQEYKMSNKNKLPIDLDLKPLVPLPENVQSYFKLCEVKLGLIPNVLKAYTHNIEKLNSFTSMYNEVMLGDSGLSKLEREMIAVVVSSINKCYYCQVAHGSAVRELSGKPELSEELIMNFRIADLPKKHKTMLEFSAKLTEKSSETNEDDRKKLREVGFSDSDIWDISSVVGFFNMSNRIASASNMKPNKEYHSKAR